MCAIDDGCKPYLGSEDGCVGLHGALHLSADLGGALGAGRVAQLVQALQRLVTRIRRQGRLLRAGLGFLRCTGAPNVGIQPLLEETRTCEVVQICSVAQSDGLG